MTAACRILLGLRCKVGATRRDAVADKPGHHQRDEHPEGSGVEGKSPTTMAPPSASLGPHDGAQGKVTRPLGDDAVASQGKQDADAERRAPADRKHGGGPGHHDEHR